MAKNPNQFELQFGDRTTEYPCGYGYCRCGCGKITPVDYRGQHRPFFNAIHRRRYQRANNKSLRSHKCHPVERHLSKADLERMYYDEEKSMQEIADACGYSQRTIVTWMREYGLKARGRSEMRRLALRKGRIKGHAHHEINEAFFDEWSEAMAWVLGLIYTDGYLRKNSLRLAMNDLDVLQKVAGLMSLSKSIREDVKNGPTVFNVLEFTNEHVAMSLRKLGVHQAKSFSITFPAVPKEYTRHFIRGCWDGDGGIRHAYGNTAAYYTSGSQAFVERLSLELFEASLSITHIFSCSGGA